MLKMPCKGKWYFGVLVRGATQLKKSVKCRNPNCSNEFVPKAKRFNTEGQTCYCSIECARTFTPYMYRAALRLRILLPQYDHVDNLQDFLIKGLSFYYKSGLSLRTISKIIGVSRGTCKKWIKMWMPDLLDSEQSK